MKKSILFLLAICAVATATAQDLIVKTDSTRIEAVVSEISTENVRYKRFARPEGPTYVIPVANICYIRYSDGFVEDYNRAKPQPQQIATTTEQPQTTPPQPTPAPQPAPAPAPVPVQQPVQQPTPAPTPMAQSAPAPQMHVLRFEVGQYYDYNGLQGVVFAVNEDGTHGLIVSLDEVMIDWSTFRKDDLRKVGATDQHHGEKNMEAVARYIAENNLSWDHFPAFKWCREKGEGWYLPSIDEVLQLGNNYNGGNRMHNNRQARLTFNENLKEHGGERIDGKCFYFSSTELNEKIAMSAHMGMEAPYVFNEIPKYSKFLIRAVHKF
ncbi:MAG: hypothetical protein J6A66_05590 [Alistipes sp.]|nr:hypothetical protein [Alistipes sp.]